MPAEPIGVGDAADASASRRPTPARACGSPRSGSGRRRGRSGGKSAVGRQRHAAAPAARPAPAVEPAARPAPTARRARPSRCGPPRRTRACRRAGRRSRRGRRRAATGRRPTPRTAPTSSGRSSRELGEQELVRVLVARVAQRRGSSKPIRDAQLQAAAHRRVASSAPAASVESTKVGDRRGRALRRINMVRGSCRRRRWRRSPRRSG